MDPLVFLHDHWAEGAFGYKVIRDDAWPVVKRLLDHYRHDKPETIARATLNATDLAHRFEAQVLALRNAKLLTDEQIRVAMESPEFAQSLQQAFIDGSETSSEFKHEQLARLVAMQLTGDGESFQSIALRMAAERMKHLTDRQLRELGLMFTIMDIGFTYADDDPTQVEDLFRDYCAGCEKVLAPFRDVQPLNVDLHHMEGLSLLRIAPFATVMLGSWSGSEETHSRLLEPLSSRFYGLLSPIGALDAPPIIARMHRLMNGDWDKGITCLRGVKLFPPGYIIGHTVYSNMQKENLALDGFD